jgi:hypothetical protein
MRSLAGTEGANRPTQQMPGPHDHGRAQIELLAVAVATYVTVFAESTMFEDPQP